jgi:alpha-L-fucosidase
LHLALLRTTQSLKNHPITYDPPNHLITTQQSQAYYCVLADFAFISPFLMTPLSPAKATLPHKNFTYDYKVQGYGRDVVKSFAESCSSVGVKLGIYYSVVSNEYLNVAGGDVRDPKTATADQYVVTQDEYADIVQQQLTELWTQYGDLAEIWFDGGFKGPNQTDLLALLNSSQPHACVFNGCGLSPNAVAWIGTESGHAPYPVWNTQDGCPSGAGTPDGVNYVPKEVDLTLQNSDTWFFKEGVGYRSLAEMVGIYHDSVGHGGNMLLNIAPPPNSTLPEAAMAEYAALGTFISECYGEGSIASATALATTTEEGGVCKDGNCSSIVLVLPPTPGGATIDRFLLKEGLGGGQRVMAFSIIVNNENIIFNGTAIGRTFIVRLPTNVTGVTKVELRITEAKLPPAIRLFAVPSPTSCIVGGGGLTGCKLIPNTLYKGINIEATEVKTVAECCTACRGVPACAFFTAVPGAVGSFHCSLMSAQQGSSTVTGATSGSPKR